MNTNRNRTVLALGIALALAAGGASATNGYYTHGVGTKSKGQAGAGSANPEELLILATNPAGLTEVGASLDAGLGFFMPMRYYKTSDSDVNGACFSPSPADCTFTIGPNDLRSGSEFFMVPFIGRSWKLSDNDVMALGFYGRGGMNTRWEGGTATFVPLGGTAPAVQPGTYGGGTAGVDLMQGFLNLSYAREFADQFSVGASAIFALQRFEARGVEAFTPYTESFLRRYFTEGVPGLVENLTDNGHDMSYGYGGTVGLRWQPVDMFSIAAAYTTKMTMSHFNDYGDLYAEDGGFDMPSTWTVGVALKPVESLTLMFDVQEIKYTDVDSVSNPIDNLQNCPLFNPTGDFEYCLGGDKGPGFGWEDMTVYKFGVSWQYSDDWTWRAGYSMTDQPIPKDQMIFNILAPGVIEEHFTFGFTQKMKNGNELNLSFMYAPEFSVNGPNTFEPDVPAYGLEPQDIELRMQEFELEISYSWKR